MFLSKNMYNFYKKFCILETLTLSTCADNSFMSKKLNKTFGSNMEHLSVFKALHKADLEQKARTIQESNPGQRAESVKILFFERYNYYNNKYSSYGDTPLNWPTVPPTHIHNSKNLIYLKKNSLVYVFFVLLFWQEIGQILNYMN